MNRSMSFTLAFVAALAGTVPAAVAQAAWGSTHVHPWPTSEAFQPNTAVGPFGRGCAGDFTGDRMLDAVVLDGELPVLLSAPDRYSAFKRLPLAASDIAVLPASDSGAGRDVLVGVGASGLARFDFDPEAADFASPSVIDGDAWSGARLVRVAQLDGSAGVDFLGVANDGFTVQMLLAQGAGAYTAGSSFTVSHSILEIEAIEWDGDTGRELVLRTSAGLEVREMSGSTILSVPHFAPGGALAVLKLHDYPKERLVWITATAEPGEQVMYVVDEGECVSALELGTLGVAACATADVDRDGDDDLYLSLRHSHTIALLENGWDPEHPNEAAFVGTDTTLIDLEWPSDEHVTAPSNAAQPIPGDFNHDGKMDCVFAVEGETYSTAAADLVLAPYVHILRGGWTDPEPFHVGLGTSALLQDPTSGGIELHVTLQRPPVLSAPAAIIATHVEVTVWRQASIEDPVEATAVGCYRFSIAGGWPIADATIPLPEVPDEDSPLVFDTIYKLEIGLIRLSPQGARLMEVFPAFTGALVASDASLQDVAGEPDSKSDPGEQFLVTSPPVIDPRDDAEIIEKPDVKPFDDDEVPKKPEP